MVTKHRQRLIYLVQAHSLFALFQVPYKAQAQPGSEGKLPLCESRSSSSLFDKGPKRVDWLHGSIIYPKGYKIKEDAVNIP